MTHNGPRILTLDIETSPALVYTFQMFNTNIHHDAIVVPTRMLCFAAKWYDEKRVIYFSEHLEGREIMVQAAHTLLNEADVVVTYNGDRFDLPHLGREFQLAGLTPPSPYASVDLYKVVKKNHVYLSHKLVYVTEQLGLTGKLAHQGFSLWTDFLAGDPKAQNVMRRYNKQDVVTTEELFDELLPLVTNMPAAALLSDYPQVTCCPNCGSFDYQRRGFAYAKTRKYPRFTCNQCGKWFKGVRSEGGTSAA